MQCIPGTPTLVPACRVVTVMLAFLMTRPARAQLPAADSAWLSRGSPTWIGSRAEDRLRLAQLTGRAPTDGWMMRTASSRFALAASSLPNIRTRPRCSPRWATVQAEGSATWSSDIPSARNDGSAWAGRGLTVQALGGVRVLCGRLRVYLVPEVWYAANTDFAVLASPDPQRSSFASPWYLGKVSGDLPIRFGTEPVTMWGPGESFIEFNAGYAAVGIGTEAQWWGPGIRNAILMSNNAGGVPHAFLRTVRPVSTPIGAVEARWIVGTLTESPFFDFARDNDKRSLSGIVAALRPAFDTNLTIGAARVVYAAIRGTGALPGRALDAVARWGQGANLREATAGRRAEQLSSVFARFVLPRAGAEVYGEWARVIFPASVRTFLVSPQYSQGYTVGLQVAGGSSTGSIWRFQAEATNLEQSPRFRGADPPSFYVSPVVPQGYTQRGQSLGASIGSGGSSQWLALDRVRERWSAGVFLGRIRWSNDEFYRRPTGFSLFAQDVSILAGGRGDARVANMDVTAEILNEHRMNYLFQSATLGYDVDRTFDVRNWSIRLTLSPVPRS